MKKLILSAAAVFAFGFANAQEATESYKPSKGTIATEVGLVGGLNNANFNLNTGVLKFRYFLKDDMAVRLGLGLNSSKTEEIDNSTPTNVETEIFKNSSTAINLGVEKHFAGSDRLSTYAGADLVIGFTGASYEYTENNYSYTEDASNTLGNRAGSNFGVRIFTGADYYIAKKVFLGVEAGLGISSNKNKDNTITETGNPTVNVAGGKGNNLTTAITGGVRIGYQF